METPRAMRTEPFQTVELGYLFGTADHCSSCDPDKERGPQNDHTDNSITGLGNSMTAVTEAATPSEEAEDDDSRVMDELLLGVGSGSKSSGIVGVSVASTHIPQLPPYFVLELLSDLHFILCPVQPHLAVSAFHALAQRVNLKLWSNALVVLSGTNLCLTIQKVTPATMRYGISECSALELYKRQSKST
nr:hypothetical transcript [Hymenolepis microstoma]